MRMYMMDFGYIMLGFGNSMSYSFGYSLLRGDTRDVLHRERNQILGYQVILAGFPSRITVVGSGAECR